MKSHHINVKYSRRQIGRYKNNLHKIEIKSDNVYKLMSYYKKRLTWTKSKINKTNITDQKLKKKKEKMRKCLEIKYIMENGPNRPMKMVPNYLVQIRSLFVGNYQIHRSSQQTSRSLEEYLLCQRDNLFRKKI